MKILVGNLTFYSLIIFSLPDFCKKRVDFFCTENCINFGPLSVNFRILSKFKKINMNLDHYEFLYWNIFLKDDL